MNLTMHEAASDSHSNADQRDPFAPGDVFGEDRTSGLVAVERLGENSVRLYRRINGRVVDEQDEFVPWLVGGELAEPYCRGATVELLDGDAPFRLRFLFDSWSDWRNTYERLREARIDVVALRSPTDQYLVMSGRSLFRGMSFDQLVRAQIDIETLTLDSQAQDAEIIIITASVNGQSPLVLRADEVPEPDMLDALTGWIRDLDPDVIEGHNLFNFDIPYLLARASRHGHTLLWGRDGSPLRLGREQRFKAGARSVPFQSAYVYGRHIVDTYQQIQRYDTGGELESYGLKPALVALGLSRTHRTYVEGPAIAAAWKHEREDLVRYAIDDALDVNTVSELALPTEFYQAQILPRSLQSVATGGPGEKINDLLIRAYVAAGRSLPSPSHPKDYPGGYAELRRTGRFSPVVKCDVESLYPSIMLADNIGPGTDDLGVFIPMLRELASRRLYAKREEQRAEGRDRAQWRGIQSSLKVLINSFYGYLGYSRALFNDYDAATRVTLRGQDIIQGIVTQLEARGSTAIEVDTDGVFFQPPPEVETYEQELALIDSVNATLDPGIRLAHDGRYRAMLSLKLKNYALLAHDGRTVLKGSSLRSRREEPFLRRFLREAIGELLLDPTAVEHVRETYLLAARRVIDNDLNANEIGRMETITHAMSDRRNGSRGLEGLRGERVGERIAVYQRADGTLARIADFNHDADPDYLLRRLKDMTERFRPLFPLDSDFAHTFPRVTTRSNIDAVTATPKTTQLNLFGESL